MDQDRPFYVIKEGPEAPSTKRWPISSRMDSETIKSKLDRLFDAYTNVVSTINALSDAINDLDDLRGIQDYVLERKGTLEDENVEIPPGIVSEYIPQFRAI